MRLSFVILACPLLVSVVLPPQVSGQTAKLQAAKGLTIKLSVTQVGGATEEQTIQFSRPASLRIEGPTTLTVSDGKTVWTHNKTTNIYSEVAFSDEWLKKTIGTDILWAWSGFFDKNIGEAIQTATKGSARKVKSVAVTDHNLTLKDKRTFTLQLDDATGLTRGVVFSRDTGTGKSDTILFAKEISLSDSPIAEATFAFVPPKEAKKAEAMAAAGPKYADISDILNRGCVGCHGQRGAQKGINLSSYASVMRSGIVKPGDAAGSRMMQVIHTNKMPPGAPLLPENSAKLAAWIDAGAQE